MQIIYDFVFTSHAPILVNSTIIVYIYKKFHIQLCSYIVEYKCLLKILYCKMIMNVQLIFILLLKFIELAEKSKGVIMFI